jgi:hypothetical protein
VRKKIAIPPLADQGTMAGCAAYKKLLGPSQREPVHLRAFAHRAFANHEAAHLRIALPVSVMVSCSQF